MGGQDERLTYEFGEFRLDPARRRLSRIDGRRVIVRDKVLDTLICLVEHAGRPIDKGELLRAVWPDAVVEENNLNQAISTLRRLLDDDRQAPRFIATLTGRGYQFIGDVRRFSDRSGPDTGTLPRPAIAADVLPYPSGFARRRFRASSLAALALAGAAAVLIATVGLPVGAPDGVDGPLARSGRLLTDVPANHTHPVFRSDGSMMAFASDASGDWQIWIQPVAGGAPVQITHGEGSAHDPSWSPLNDRIAFHRVRRGQPPSIWSVDPLGTTAPRLILERGVSPSFSHDGRTLVYADPAGEGIWLADADGASPRRVDGVQHLVHPPSAEPALSPDGRHIAYFAGWVGPLGDLWIIPSAGGEPRRLTFDEGLVGSPAWTPDGRFVIYRSARAGAPNLWAVPFEGGDPRAMTSGAGEHGTPAVSRDGRYLLYSDRRTRWTLMRTDPEGGVHRPVVESRHSIYGPEVSPDGRRIAYFAEVASGVHVFTVDSKGGNPRQVTFGEGEVNVRPTWSPDGESLVFYQEKPSGSLVRLPLSGGAPEELIADFRYDTHPAAREGPPGDAVVFVRLERPGSDQPGRTFIRDLTTGRETALPLPVVGSPSWSRQGDTVLGARPGGEMVICPATSGPCRVLTDGGEPVRGVHPRWSSDESRIFFVRLPQATGSVSELWVVDRDGRHARKLIDLAPRDAVDRRFDVTPQDQVIWGRVERGHGAIWIADLEIAGQRGIN